MALFLVLDIGNSNTKWGVFKEGVLLKRGVFSNALEIPDILKRLKVTAVAYCASGEINELLEGFIGTCPHSLNIQDISLPFDSLYESTETLGRDRVAAIAGGASIFNDSDLLIIDSGTCITYDFYSKDGLHEGGCISPGLKMRLKSMNAFTDRLPLVSEIPNAREPLAKSTYSAISQGAFLGLLYETEGFISYFMSLYPKLKILITGGDAWIFVKFIKIKIFAEPNLVLKGLNEILKNYAAKKGWN